MAGAAAEGELDLSSSAEFSRKTSSRQSGRTDLLQEVALRLRGQGEDPEKSKVLRVAKTIQKRVSELAAGSASGSAAVPRDRPRPSAAPPASARINSRGVLVPDGQFGPHGDRAPQTPLNEMAPLPQAAEPSPEVREDTSLHGQKRDVEEAELPEAPSRG